MADSVSYKVVDGIAILSVSNPPGDALSVSMRRGLIDGLDRALADSDVAAVLVMGEGRSFPVGTDISELGQTPQEPTISNVCDRFEAFRKPVIAVLHGMVLGGGFEIALGAHYRVATVDACFGLPEVSLGILPGAGGTQRVPRLAGAELALELMLSGKPMQASDPRAAVFFDALIEGDLREGAIAIAQELVDQGAGPRPTRAVESGFEDPMDYQRSISVARSKLARTREAAPREIVNCVEAAALLPFDQGVTFERAAFETLVSSDQSMALRHAFVAENRAATFPQSKGARLREVTQVGIVGGGTMGRGIAMSCLAAGLEVILVERDMTALETAMNRVDLTLDRAVKRAQLTASDRDRQRVALTGASDLVALSNVDFVIEAAPEDMDVKLAVFSQLDGVVKDGAILATSTSYLDVNQMARATGAPGDVLGLHFFPPATSPRVVEVIVGEETSPDTTATSLALIKRLGRFPVQSRMSDGYIGNRVQSACYLAADLMLEAGATPYLIDEAMENWGMARGPY
ncbi:3-hydroxyacyl-CoA dehydrogenase NAD-binding domain-containing protein [Shimia sediminis]|uniref:3-hydroxyacyl-CoA dehydrogenase NAD-binding domain-containing protein n=1 Tax=Shimia sediminis TaxID=2497945 RepID=UPI0013DEDCCB|nr:3-hydroxyacyl-CoA dehydrogenase NAD-binding domain-containing protein [Shimia sediminis]